MARINCLIICLMLTFNSKANIIYGHAKLKVNHLFADCFIPHNDAVACHDDSLISKSDTALQKSKACIKINKQYISSYFKDTKAVFLAPAKFRQKDWIITYTTAAIGLSILSQDRQIAQFFQSNLTKETMWISKNVAERFGSGVYSLPVLGGFYIHSLITKDCRSNRTAMLGVKSFIIASAIAQIPKYAFQRHRPYRTASLNPYLFDGPFGKYIHNSFPSGHTVAAFSIANSIARQYKDKKWVGIVCYSLATLTGISRIHDNKHWASDVFFGAALGIGISNVIFNIN